MPVRRSLRWLVGGSPPAAPGAWFRAEDIERIHDVYYSAGPGVGGPWDAFRDAHLILPEWFVRGLDPWGDAYARQQHRLWSVMSGVELPYEPVRDEREEAAWSQVDPLREPGFYSRRDRLAISSAADHLLASGMILQHSGLQAGDWALEYGAGFAQTSLALARLGVNVDTVDISPMLCEAVRLQAAHFQVPLSAFEGCFGDAPRANQRYQLIFFYESFHHCVDFLRVVPRLHRLLAPGGRVILAGEPIVDHESPAFPYPWGVRLHSEVAAVMRRTGWFELGFSESFLHELFRRFGFTARRVECAPSAFGRLHIFEPGLPSQSEMR